MYRFVKKKFIAHEGRLRRNYPFTVATEMRARFHGAFIFAWIVFGAWLSACDAEKKWMSDGDTDPEISCLVQGDDKYGYACVHASPDVCEYRLGFPEDGTCAELDMASCEDGTWTKSACPGDRGGVCVIGDNDSGVSVCVPADRGECLVYAEEDGHWRSDSCPENGFDRYCPESNVWVSATVECVRSFSHIGSCVVADFSDDESSFCFNDTQEMCELYEGDFTASVSCSVFGYNYACFDQYLYLSADACVGN